MKIKPTMETLQGVLSAAVFFAVSGIAQAQFPVLGNPSGWKAFPQASDEFNSAGLDAKWVAIAKTEDSKTKSGQNLKSRFRTQNVQTGNGNLNIVMWWQPNAITEGGTTFNYSGGWCISRANYITEGQFQSQLKVSYVFPDVWPTFWLVRGGGDELDIMEYQSNVFNQTHHFFGNGKDESSPQLWAPWQEQTRWRWGMDRVTGVGGLSNFASRARRTSFPQFFINNKQEHQSNLRAVNTQMEMLFTGSPHKNHLPAGAQNYPRMEVNWVRTLVP